MDLVRNILILNLKNYFLFYEFSSANGVDA